MMFYLEVNQRLCLFFFFNSWINESLRVLFKIFFQNIIFFVIEN